MAGEYKPSSYLESANRNATSAMREKHPLPMLRIFGSNEGNQWLSYGGFNGGTQDEADNCKWILILYNGILRINGENVFGFWELMITGSGLDPLAADLSRHAENWLRVGRNDQCEHPFTIESMEFTASKISKQPSPEDNGEGHMPDC